MQFLEQLAATYTTYTTYTTTTNDVDAGVLAGMMIFYVIFIIGSYVLTSWFMMMLFKKAGVAGWKAWVPAYNMWKMLQLGGQPGWWVILAFIPFVNIASLVFLCIAAYNIGLKLSKDGVWVVLFIFLEIVWLGILGLDSSKWDDSKGAKSLTPEVMPPTSAPDRAKA